MGWAVRSLARMVFPTLARHGWSYAKMLAYSKGRGWTYAPKVMASDIREMRNSAEFGRKVMALDIDIPIPKAAMSPTELRLPRKYRVFGQAVERNVETGRLRYSIKSMYDNRLSTKQEWEQIYIDEKLYEKTDPLWVAESFSILEVQHNIGYPY